MSDRQIAFVADGQIPPSPPPAATTGVLGWLRENLFSGIFNSILTIFSILLIVFIVPGALEWALVNGIFDAGNIRECRAVLAIPVLTDHATANGITLDRAAMSTMGLEAQHKYLLGAVGDAAKDLHVPAGACWAVIVDRFDQFIYGFYPEDLRWRANLAFILMLLAIAFVLFDKIPFRRYGMVFSFLYPIIGFYLIWGGGVDWFVAIIPGMMASIIIFFLGEQTFKEFGFQPAQAIQGAQYGSGIFFLLYMAIVIFMALFSDGGAVFTYGFEPVESAKIGGFLLALIIGLSGIVFSLPLGVLLALGRRSGMPFIQGVSIVFIEFIRGVPLITLLFVANSVLNYFAPPGQTTMDIILRVIIMVTLFSSAYMAEVVRGGLAALSQGQYEAGDSLGLNYWQSMRLIILPQALKISIPNIVSSFIGLFKDTTLVVVIGLLDPIGLIGTIRAHSDWNGLVWEFYIFVALFFFIFCFGMSRYSIYLERKLATDRQ